LVRPQCNRSGLGGSINRVFSSPSGDDHGKFSNDMPTISQISLSGFLTGEFMIQGDILFVSTLCMTYQKIEPIGLSKAMQIHITKTRLG
jgi:hypothetical protein